MNFCFTFSTITIAIGKLFIIMLAGYVLYYLKTIDGDFVDKLSQVLVRLFFPALIVARTINSFSFQEYSFWWVLPIAAAAFSIFGMLIAWPFLRLFNGKFNSKREFITSCGFQNSGYLPMNLILFSFQGPVADKLLIYMFLFLLGFNVLIWSLVPLFFRGRLRKDFKISVLFTPPVIATCFSLLWVAFLGKGSMPDIIFEPLSQIGNAAFPISMFTLGAYLCKYSAFNPENKLPLFCGILVKLFIFPLLVLTAFSLFPGGADYKFFLFLQAVMPTAVSLVIIGSYTGADNKFLSSIIFYTHVISIISIPLWFAIFCKFSG